MGPGEEHSLAALKFWQQEWRRILGSTDLLLESVEDRLLRNYQQATLDIRVEQVAAIEEGFDRLIEALQPVEPLTAEESIPRDNALLDMLHRKQRIRDLVVARKDGTPSEEDGA